MNKKKRFKHFAKKTTINHSTAPTSDEIKNQRSRTFKETGLSLWCLKSIENLILAVLLILPLIFWVNFSIAVVKETVFETLVIIMLFFWLVRQLELAKITLKINFFNILILIFFLLMIISTVISPDSNMAFWGSASRGEGLKFFIFLIIYFFIFTTTINKESQIKKIIKGLIWVSLPLSLYGILQHFGINIFPIPYNFSIDGGLIRSFSTFGNPIFFSSWLLFIIPITVYQTHQHYQKIGSKRFFSHYFTYIYLAILMIQLGALLFTFTRAAIFALIIGLFILMVILAIIKKIKWLWISSLAGFVIVVGGLVLLNLPSNPLNINRSNPWVNRFADITSESSSFRSRQIIWESVIKAVNNRPILGFGPDAYESFSMTKEYFNPKMLTIGGDEARIDRAHNIFLDQALAFGYAGLIVFALTYLFILFFLVEEIFKKNIEDKNRYFSLTIFVILTIYLIQNLAAFPDVVEYSLFITMLALAYRIYNKEEIQTNYSLGNYSKNTFWFYLLPFFALAAVGYWLIFSQYQAEAIFRQALKESKADKKIALFKKAQSLNPRNYQYLNKLTAVVKEQLDPQKMQEAETIINKSIETRPQELANYLFKSALLSNWGKFSENKYQDLEKNLNRALEKFGFKADIYQEYIRYLSQRSKFDLAEEKIQLAKNDSIFNGKDMFSYRFYLAAAEGSLQAGNFNKAIEYLNSDYNLQTSQASNQKYWYLGFSYYRIADFAKAKDSWQKCLEINQRDSNCLNGLIVMNKELKKYDLVEKYLDDLAKIDAKKAAAMKKDIENLKK